MSVSSVKEDWSAINVNTQVTLEGKSGSLTRQFTVVFSDGEDVSARAILSLTADAGGVKIPDYWEVHPYSEDYFVVRKSVAVENGPYMWRVTVEYEYVENPFNQPYSIQYIPQGNMEAIDKAIEVDGEGNEEASLNLCNSADEPFDPPIQEEFFDMGIIIKRNELNIDANSLKGYLNKVNLDAFKFMDKAGNVIQYPAGQVLCKSIQMDEKRYGQYWYFQVTYEFIVREDGWKRRILNQGFREKSGTDYVAIADANGDPVTQPVKLSALGAKLGPTDDPVFLEFQTKFTKSFSYFNFENVVQI